MAQITIDLSGQAGLMSYHGGDEDTIVASPSHRLSTGTGEMASGLFNPYLRRGYMSPAVNTTVTLTSPALSSGTLRSVDLDRSSGEVFWGDSIKTVYKQNNLGASSISSYSVFDNSGVGGWTQLDDLQTYELNGEKVLYVSGSGRPLGAGPEIEVAFFPAPDVQAVYGMNAASFGSTRPSLNSIARLYNASSLNNITGNLTVAAGTNRTVYAVVFHSNTETPTSVTFDGVSMTQIFTDDSLGIRFSYYKRTTAATTGTFSFAANFAAAQAHRLAYVFCLNEAALGSSTDIFSQLPLVNSSVSLGQLNFTRANSLNIFTVHSQNNTAALTIGNLDFTAWSSGVGGHISATSRNAIIAYTKPEPAKMLQVGILDPNDLANLDKRSWLFSLAQGGAVEEVKETAFMRVADNGFMYVLHDNKVHSINGGLTGGTRGSISRNVLLFPDYFTITDALDYRSRLFIAVHQNIVNTTSTNINTFPGACGLYIWDRQSTQLSRGDYIQLYGVKEIKKIYPSADGVVKLIVIADNNLTELREFGYNDSGGVVFRVVKVLGQGAFPQFPDGLTNASDKVLWLGNDSTIYCESSNRVHKLSTFVAQPTTANALVNSIEGGAIIYGYTTDGLPAGFRENKQAVTFSRRTTSTNTHVFSRLFPFDTNNTSVANLSNAGNAFTGVEFIPIGSNVRGLRIYNLPTSVSDATFLATVRIYFNQGTGSAHPSGITKTVTGREAKRGYLDFKINSQNIHAVQISIEWAAAVNVRDSYKPSVAILDYEPTTQSGPDDN